MTDDLLWPERFSPDYVERMRRYFARMSADTPNDTGWDDPKSDPAKDVRDAIKKFEHDAGYTRPRPLPAVKKPAAGQPWPDWMLEQWDREPDTRPPGIPQHIIDDGRRSNEVFQPHRTGSVVDVGTAGTLCDYCNATGRVLPFVGEEINCPKCKGAGRTITSIAISKAGGPWLIGVGKVKDLLKNRPRYIVNKGDWWLK